jgi:hypothetical protein
MNLSDLRFIRFFAPLGLAAVLTACPPPPANPTVYESVLTGANVVPAVTTIGTGTATGTTNGTILTIAGDVDKLSSAITQATLTCGAAAGANAPSDAIVKPLEFTNSSTLGRGTIYGTITGGTEADRTSLNNGLCYIQVYTGSSPEIRGQLIKRAGQ